MQPTGRWLIAAWLGAFAYIGLGTGCSHPLAEPRSQHRALGLADGDALVVGGEGRAFHTATRLPDGSVWVVGGRAMVDGSMSSDVLSATELYDPRKDAWRPGPTLDHARAYHSTTVVGRVLLVAGGSPSGWGGERPLSSVELFDLRTGEHDRVRLRRNRTDHQAVAVGRGQVLLVGGTTEPFVSKWPLRWAERVRLPRRWREAAKRSAPRRLPTSWSHAAR